MSRVGRTYEELWDERSIRVDNEKTFEYQPAYDTKKGKDNKIRHAAIRGIHERTLLNQLYFSEKNIKNVQNKIRYTIFRMSKGQFKIGEQEETKLAIIMRSIYLQYSRNLPTNIKEQIQHLNEIVVDQITPNLLSNVKQYLKYLEDINEPWRLMSLPQATTSKGTKVLEMHSALGFGDVNFKFQ